ncbi:MAG: biotin--[acetyl-CoA-carboxylase] ligase [Planctomycetota bacterium]
MPSTNDVAIEFARTKSLSTPFLVLTEEQTAGRGQHSRKWIASRGSLTFSLIVPETFVHSGVQPLLSLAAGLSCAREINGLCSLIRPEGVRVKWPNDLVVIHEGVWKKLGGILVESLVAPGAKRHFVIGIGINVANSLEAAPEEVVSSATSLLHVSTHPPELQTLLVQLLQRIETVLSLDPSRLIVQINELSILTGKSVQLSLPDGSIVGGICRGVAADGAICLESVPGDDVQEFVSGSVAGWDEMSNDLTE